MHGFYPFSLKHTVKITKTIISKQIQLVQTKFNSDTLHVDNHQQSFSQLIDCSVMAVQCVLA